MTKITLQKVLFGLLLTTVFFTASAQDKEKEAKPVVKKSNVGISVNFHDFDTDSMFPREDSAYGFSAIFWKGITPHLDYSIRFNGIFPNQNRNNRLSKNFISPELEAAVHAKAFAEGKAKLNPFLTLGIGGGYYNKDLTPHIMSGKTNTWNAHAFGGVGLEFNIKSEVYLFAQANYRYSFSDNNLPHNMLYSFGITRSVTKVKKTPPPPPDRDMDGVIDAEDACPDVPGLVALKGCPDKDGDGIADKDDACPDQAGPASLNGCPDRDGDGIADKDDKCPDVKGLAKYQGCPIPDTDGDGINDEEDKCKTVPGVARYQGCPVPDTDGDGINDEEDKCPNLAGVRENQGCPAISEEVKEKVSIAAKNILFITGSAKLQKKSFKGLDDVVAIMKENPEIKLQIDGHTDAVGSDESNQILSDNRAASVKSYIVSKGIDESRITSAGHGESQPIADNKTAAGRQQNRRVEMVLTYFQ